MDGKKRSAARPKRLGPSAKVAASGSIKKSRGAKAGVRTTLAARKKKTRETPYVSPADKRESVLPSWWALQEIATPFALVEGGRVAMGNRGFDELSRASAGASWQRFDSSSTERPCRGLTRLLVSEVAALRVEPCQPITRMYRRVGKDQYLEASYWAAAGQPAERPTVVMVREATAHVQAEHEIARVREALLQNERMRAIGELAAGVAHDLNNTLHAMNLRLSLIDQNEACRSAQGTNIAALSRAINDAALVVGRLQDFARPQTERSPDCVDVAAVVTEAIDMVRTTIEGETSLDGAPVRIRTELPPLPLIMAQASEVRHVVVNLLLNARDALTKGGTIQVVGRSADDRVVLEVLDDGCGIPAKDLENIFCPFFTTKGARGTGLGLFNARARLGRLGGDISANNRQSGGACFTLTFPLAPPLPAPVPKRSSAELPRGRRILVVDDDFDNLQATKMVMELHGQSADTAQSGSEAIGRLLDGSRYDLVFCDLGMPDMSGWRIAQEIRKLAPETVVYMLTGWAQNIEMDDPRRGWVKGILQKPMKADVMRELLADELFDGPRDPASGPRAARDHDTV